MSESYERALEVAIQAAKTAGAMLREDFHRPGGPQGHGAHAEMDEPAERAVRALLEASFPEYGYRGEETEPKGRPATDAGHHMWLVDPNDGTSSYLKGARGSAVSIALLRDGQPVLGVVFAFSAPDDNGDLMVWAEGCGPLLRNGRPVERSWPAEATPEVTVLAAQGADRRPVANLHAVAPMRFRAAPSIAYRLALAAVGEGDVAVSLHNPGDWDYAGGHALLRGAGADLYDTHGEPVFYTREGVSRCGGRCFGGPQALARTLAQRNWTAVHLPTLHGPDGSSLVHPIRGRAVADADLLARAQGCLLGQVAGDSLGAQVEFQTHAEIAKRYPGGLRELHDGGAWNLQAGQPTDDSELALELARSIVSEKGYQPEAVHAAYHRWFRSSPFDVGHTTRRAFEESTPDQISQANGALMRVSPLGIFAAGGATGGEAEEWARADARLTHPHPVCQEANAIYVRALMQALKGADRVEIYQAALEQATELAGTLESAREGVPDLDGPQQGWVKLALQNAFYQLMNAASFEEGMVDTVMRGGDTDTNGAIAGALLGAYFGRDAIPPRWRNRVLTCRSSQEGGARRPRPERYWPVDALVLAEHLLLAYGAGAR